MDTSSWIPYESKTGQLFQLIHLDSALACLRDAVRVDKDFATGLVRSIDKLFRSAYGYYYLNNNILASEPIENPHGWMIYNGTSGGQVNYQWQFKALEKRIRRDGYGTGMLTFEIADILMRAKDAHTNIPWKIFYDFHLVDRGDRKKSKLLNLRAGNRTAAEVVIVYDSGLESEETKVVKSINGNGDPLDFLERLLELPGSGAASQFKSPGVRMNAFLRIQDQYDDWRKRLRFFRIGDFSKLPSSLSMVLDDSTTETWDFMALIDDRLAHMPPYELADEISAGIDRFEFFKEVKGSDRGIPARYLIRPDPSGFEWLSFKEGEETRFSGYLVKDNTLIWKIPTFYWSDDWIMEVRGSWSALVGTANEREIDTLLIDISDNEGGLISVAAWLARLLFPDASLEDAVLPSNARISKYHDTLAAAGSLYDELKTRQDSPALVSYLFDVMTIEERVDLLQQICALAIKADTVASKEGPVLLLGQSWWYGANMSVWSQLQEICSKDVRVWLPSDTEHVLKVVMRLIEKPSVCSGEKICSIKKYKATQSGRKVVVATPTTQSFHLSELKKDEGRFADLDRSPFEKIALYSNSAIVGSASNVFEMILRHLGRPDGPSTWPKVTTYASGGTGRKDNLAMTSFTGAISVNPSYIIEQYLTLLALEMQVMVSKLPASGVPKNLAKSFWRSVKKVAGMIPPPPDFDGTIPNFSTMPIYYPGMDPRTTIPVEFFLIPPDEYLAIWPRSPESFQEIYDIIIANLADTQ